MDDHNRVIVPDGTPLAYWWKTAQDHQYEYAPSAFWQQFLQLEFPYPEYSVIGEQSPDDGSRRRVDTVVYFHEDEYKTTSTLLFVEAKKCSYTNAKKLEEQAYDAAKKHLQNRQNQERVYAMTTIGTRARMWSLSRKQHHLRPLFGADAKSHASYIEITSDQGFNITRWLARIRGEDYDPSGSSAVQDPSSSTGQDPSSSTGQGPSTGPAGYTVAYSDWQT